MSSDNEKGSMEDFTKTMRRRRWKAFKRNPIKFITTRVNSAWYDVRCFFFPFNVVKCHDLERSWCDRDWLMFHAMFQIIVDFVELEQEYKEWDTKYKEKRYTDREAMHAWIEKHYNTEEGRQSMYWPGISEEEKAKMDKSTEKRYLIHKEIMYLYEWYKDKKYDFDRFDLHVKTGEKLKFVDGRITHVDNGQPKVITWQEAFDAEQEHEVVCDAMLKRILEVRRYLWT